MSPSLFSAYPHSILMDEKFEKEQKQLTNVTELYFASKLVSLNELKLPKRQHQQ